MEDEKDIIDKAISELCDTLKIPDGERGALHDIVVAFKEGGVRMVRNTAQTFERHAKHPPKAERTRATAALKLLESSDFEGGDPKDENLVKAARRLATAYSRLKKKQPDVETPERNTRARAAWRLVKAHQRLKPSGV